MGGGEAKAPVHQCQSNARIILNSEKMRSRDLRNKLLSGEHVFAVWILYCK